MGGAGGKQGGAVTDRPSPSGIFTNLSCLHRIGQYNKNYIGGPIISFKLTTVGSSEGFIVNKEAKAKLGVQKGDTLFSTEALSGGYRLTPYNPDFERQMSLAEEIMHDDREILRALAK